MLICSDRGEYRYWPPATVLSNIQTLTPVALQSALAHLLPGSIEAPRAPAPAATVCVTAAPTAAMPMGTYATHAPMVTQTAMAARLPPAAVSVAPGPLPFSHTPFSVPVGAAPPVGAVPPVAAPPPAAAAAPPVAAPPPLATYPFPQSPQQEQPRARPAPRPLAAPHQPAAPSAASAGGSRPDAVITLPYASPGRRPEKRAAPPPDQPTTPPEAPPQRLPTPATNERVHMRACPPPAPPPTPARPPSPDRLDAMSRPRPPPFPQTHPPAPAQRSQACEAFG